MTDWIGPALTGLGLGAIIKSVVDFFISKKAARQKLAYAEMRESYLGLLDALHKASVEPSDLNSKNFALWQTRINLFGSPEVSLAVQGIIDTNGDKTGRREKHFSELILRMREDLAKSAA